MRRNTLPMLAAALLSLTPTPAQPRPPEDFASGGSVAVATPPTDTAPALPPWNSETPAPEAIQEVAVAELGGRIYVIGGFRGDTSIADAVSVYDPDSQTWSAGPPLPTVIHHTAATSVGGKLYVIGGWSDFFATPLDAVYELDPALGSWTPKSAMPTARGSVAAAALDGKIYVAGGWPQARTNDFAVYDPAADQWQTLASLPTGRNHLGLAAAEGKIYVVGGRTALQAGVGNVSAVEVFDPSTGMWSSVAPLPRPRGGLAVTSLGPRIFAFGGEGNAEHPDGVFPDVDVYDARADEWTALPPMPTPRHGIGAAPRAGRIYVPAGGPVQNFGVTDVNEVLDVASALADPVPALGAPLRAAAAALLVLLAAGLLSGQGRER